MARLSAVSSSTCIRTYVLDTTFTSTLYSQQHQVGFASTTPRRSRRRDKSPQAWVHPGASLGHLGAILGHSGPSWALLGQLGPCWDHLGAMLGHLGAILGHLGTSWGHLGVILGHLGPILGPLGSSWGHIGQLQAEPGASPSSSHRTGGEGGDSKE